LTEGAIGDVEAALARELSAKAPRFLSAHALKGHSIHSKEGEEFGSVLDLLLDDAGWTMDYFVVDTIRWLPSRSVLVAPSWVSGIDSERGRLEVNVTADTVRAAPVFDPAHLPAHSERARSYTAEP
jgi:hypothetical protein